MKGKKDLGHILTEEMITVEQARVELEKVTGRRFDKATLWRWINRGVEGTKLETVRIGRIVMTSKQAITRFILARS